MKTKLLAVAFATTLAAGLAQAQTMNDGAAVQVEPAQTQAAPPEVQAPTYTHPAVKVQGMVPADMVYETALPDTTPVTRDEVKAELVAARAEGELSTAADNAGPTLLDHEFIGIRSRDELRNEVALARADQELNTASDNQPIERTFFQSDKTRAEVKAETLDAMSHGHSLSQGDRSFYGDLYAN